MSRIGKNLTISADSIKERRGMFHAINTNTPNHTGITKKKEDDGIAVSYEKQLIDNFKEQNSPKNTRINQIYGKFKAGCELTGEELAFLAKESPEMYKKVCEVMQERRALEARMQHAKTKQEVSLVNVNAAMTVKSNMGTGEQAEANAEINMARTNQFAQAYAKYTATLEYKNKEDYKSEAEEMHRKLEALADEREENSDELAETTEQMEAMAESVAESMDVMDEEQAVTDDVQMSDVDRAVMELSGNVELLTKPEDTQRQGKAQERKQDTFVRALDEQEHRRKKVKNQIKKSKTKNVGSPVQTSPANVNYKDLLEKTKALYAGSSSKQATPVTTSKDMFV